MLFWLAVLTGAVFVVIALSVGFYRTWVLSFHVLLSTYMAVFLTPLVAARLPAATNAPLGYLLTFLSIGVATFAVAYGAYFALFSDRPPVALPKLLDVLGAGVLGFLNGFLVASLLMLAFLLTPWGHSEFSKTYGLDARGQAANISYVCAGCDLLHWLISSADSRQTAPQVVAGLLQAVAGEAAEEEKKREGARAGLPPQAEDG